MSLVGKFQDASYEKFFYSVHHSYTGKTNLASVIGLKELDIEKLQGYSYEEIVYLLHYIYTGDKDVPLTLCPGVSFLADMCSEWDLKEACDQKMLRAAIRW